MDTLTPSDTFLFAGLRLNRRAGGLCRRSDDGEYVPIDIGSRALEVLSILVERQGDLVSRDEIMNTVWSGTAVEEANLNVQISTVRRIIDADRKGPSCIQTVPGRGYRFVLKVEREKDPEKPGTAEPDGASNHRHHRSRSLIAASAIFLLALLVLGAWRVLQPPERPDSGQTAMAAHELDRRQPAIVLPFENTSGRADQDGLAISLTRDLTDRIIRGRFGPVVPATTAEAYGSKPWDPKTVGRDNDVHFVLTGGARRQDGRLIVSAIVYETTSGGTVGSQQFDVPDSSAALSVVGQSIYESYWQNSVDTEAAHAQRDHPDKLDTRDLTLIALSTRLLTPTKEHFLERMALIDRALVLRPNDWEGLERQARLRAEFVMMGYSSDSKADLEIARNAADRLMVIDPNDLKALRAKATVLRAQRDWPGAEALARRAIDLQPTEANRHYELGFTLMSEGRHQEALESYQTAKRLAGGADPIFQYDLGIATAYLSLSQFTDAIAAARAAASELPPNLGSMEEVPHLVLIAAMSGSGEDDAARAELGHFLATPRTWHSITQIKTWPAFAANTNLLDGLRRAGMPED